MVRGGWFWLGGLLALASLGAAAATVPEKSDAETLAACDLVAVAGGYTTRWASGATGRCGPGVRTPRASSATAPTPTPTAGPGQRADGCHGGAAGWWHSLAVCPAGSVWAWGANNHGQLGNGTNADSNRPVQVSGLVGVTAVAGGVYHSLAVLSDGTVWAWGVTRLASSATHPDGLKCARPGQRVDRCYGGRAGKTHSLVLRNDGTVWAWGSNYWASSATAPPPLPSCRSR